MNHCYLFLEHWTDQGLGSLCLDSEGKCIAEFALRSPEAIQELQQGAKTLALLPSRDCSFYQVVLPKLPEAKARTALAFAVEESLAEPIEQLHFCFSTAFYQDMQYLLLVVAKKTLQQYLERLESSAVAFDSLSSDWFSLDTNEVLIQPQAILVNSPEFKGSLLAQVSAAFLAAHGHLKTHTVNAGQAPLWIAERLQHRSYIEFCQGPYQKKTLDQPQKRWLHFAAILGLACCLSYLLLQCFSLIYLNRKINILDQQITAVYQQFFPEAKQIVNPRFRISHLLKNGQNPSEQLFWQLLSKLSSLKPKQKMRLLALHYKQGKLSLRLSVADFDALANLQKQLQLKGIKSQQKEAASKAGQVEASLELSL